LRDCLTFCNLRNLRSFRWDTQHVSMNRVDPTQIARARALENRKLPTQRRRDASPRLCVEFD